MKYHHPIVRISILIALLVPSFCASSAQTVEDSLAIAQTQWQVDTIEPGIIHHRAEFKKLFGQPQYINFITIDLKKGYRLESLTGFPLEVTSKTARREGALAAINGTFYDVPTGRTNCYYREGKTVVDTTAAAELFRVTGALRFKRRSLKIMPWSKKTEMAYKKRRGSVMASGPLLVNNGAIVNFLTYLNRDFYEKRHPRSAVGIDRSKRVVFMTGDGRLPGHAIGLTVRETAYVMQQIGCRYALNLDGGGSTTLWSHKAEGNGVLNSPSTNKKFDHEGERTNASILMIKRR